MSNLDSPKMDSPKITPEELRALSRAYPAFGEKFRAAADEIEKKPISIKNPPEDGAHVLALYQSPTSGHRQWYTCEYRNGKFILGGVLNDIIAWLPAPTTDTAFDDWAFS